MAYRLRRILLITSLLMLLVSPLAALDGETETPTSSAGCEPAIIINDEGGPVHISGEVPYTNPDFTRWVEEPLIILEDQAGFVDRNLGFLMPPESQVLGQITSDFFTSPFTYSISLPQEPQASLRDVDNDGEEETGVMVYAIAYWTNVFGPAFLEKRDLYGGGWSGAHASTRVSIDPETLYEIVGGQFLIYAPDDQQGFPSGFGEDGLLFTEDDPIACGIPQGYSVVNLDDEPFTFDRSRDQSIDLIEGEGATPDDFSEMSYADAFDALVDKLSKEYAFNEYKGLDWEAIREEYRPRFEEADANNDSLAYEEALWDIVQLMRDGHVSISISDQRIGNIARAVSGGIGLGIREVDDGRTIVNYLLEGGPAAQAGIELRAEILEVNGQPIDEYISAVEPALITASTDHYMRLQQLIFGMRFPVGEEVEITFQNPDASEPETITLTTIQEWESYTEPSFFAETTGYELPVEYSILPSGYGYVKINTFDDSDRLTVDLWERMIRTMKANEIPALIIDMRENLGGNGYLADQLAAYFFDEEKALGNRGSYNEYYGDFYFDPNTRDRAYPPSEDLRYDGPVAVLIGPACTSACEFFSYDISLDDRATIVGQYPTGGLGGGVSQFYMPDDITFYFTASRAVDSNGEIHIEGKGVAPDIVVPVNEETLFSTGDPILEAAIEYLDSL